MVEVECLGFSNPAEPNPQVPETFEPYSFANNNPHLYSDPTGLFSIVEINVGQGMQGQLQNIKSIAIHQAKEYAREKAYEFATDLLIDSLTKFIPGGQFKGLIELGARFRAGTQLQLDLPDFLEKLPFADMLWFQPSIAVTGQPKWNGSNPIRGGNPNPFLGHPLPDLVIKPSNSTPLETETNAYVTSEFKLSTQTIWNDYFSTGAYVDKGKNRQWLAITNYARKHQNTPIVVFITWDPGTQVLHKKISKEAFMRGVAAVIVPIRP